MDAQRVAFPHHHLEPPVQRDRSAASDAAVEIAFQTLNRYLGVAVGEHLGYLFTGL